MADNISESDRKNFARLVAAAWADDALTQRYQDNPVAVLAEYGIEVREGEGLENPVLPPRPEGEFSVSTFGTVGSVSCPAASARARGWL